MCFVECRGGKGFGLSATGVTICISRLDTSHKCLHKSQQKQLIHQSPFNCDHVYLNSSILLFSSCMIRAALTGGAMLLTVGAGRVEGELDTHDNGKFHDYIHYIYSRHKKHGYLRVGVGLV